MSTFTNSTISVLIAGALVLGAGIAYQGYASQRLDEAEKAVQRVDSANAKAQRTKELAELYVSLLTAMEDRKTNRQEPFSMVSEFSPMEISEIGSLLGTLYQRDGHFFLQRFQIAWREADRKLGLLPRVTLDLDGRKVLLFSNEEVAASSAASEKR